MNEFNLNHSKGEQIILDPTKLSMSKTDPRGIIEYANQDFMDVCGYSERELMGKPHNIVRHPDMPKVAFKLMWDHLKTGKTFYALVKNLTKQGNYYWVIAQLTTKFDENNNIISHFAKRKAAPKEAIDKIEKIYQLLKGIEDEKGMEVSYKYLMGLLEDKNQSYHDFFFELLQKKRSDLEDFFNPHINENNLDNFNDTLKPKLSSTPEPSIPLDKEIKLNPKRFIMSKTDARGIIEYANEYFMEISGYQEYELMGQPHNIIRHPDMPQVIFKLMWERLKKGQNIYALVKNLAKDKRYYWVLTSFNTKYNEKGEIIAYYARRKAAPENAVYQIEKLYKILRKIETTQNMEISERYLKGMLEEKKLTYDQYIMQVLDMSQNEINAYFSENDQQKKVEKNNIIQKLFKN